VPRFIHTADLHINALRLRHAGYLKRARWALWTISDLAQEFDCDCIVVAGDIFEVRNTTVAERQLLSDWLGECETPVIMISGNHDAKSRRIGDTCLSYLSALPLDRHVIHDGDPTILDAFGASWLLLPYHGWNNAEFRLIVEAMAEEARPAGKPVIAVAHEAVRGCKADSGHRIKRHQQIKLTEDIDVDYWALGDIHLPQRILPNAFYCGAPHQIDFGEKQKKGVVLVDTEKPDGMAGFIALNTPHPLITLTEPPEDGVWPEFVHFATATAPDIAVPPHVVVQIVSRNETTDTPDTIPREYSDIFYGLDTKLSTTDLAPHLIPAALAEANDMLDELRRTEHGSRQ